MLDLLLVMSQHMKCFRRHLWKVLLLKLQLLINLFQHLQFLMLRSRLRRHHTYRFIHLRHFGDFLRARFCHLDSFLHRPVLWQVQNSRQIYLNYPLINLVLFQSKQLQYYYLDSSRGEIFCFNIEFIYHLQFYWITSKLQTHYPNNSILLQAILFFNYQSLSTIEQLRLLWAYCHQ